MNNGLFLACVADANRFALLRRLAEGDHCVRDLVEATGHSQSNVSHHLRRLRDCGFVTYERDGKQNRYRLSHPAVADFVRAAEATRQAIAPLCSSEAC